MLALDSQIQGQWRRIWLSAASEVDDLVAFAETQSL
jgi:hypothetical protein